ncbi:PAS domain-containing protein [Ginsengibacter hankyongi]|uniref:histidine kinase n=1 Tax=Ginsengibacter hankyongi TaxID=2607284 RepID=A0A5J5IM95_9BACT|nr:PAS domain-containing protein [Ginsengibacter hankyongi]KAA9041004.1 PAS domain-containing protein [Ginsengibacter hankyongi]
MNKKKPGAPENSNAGVNNDSLIQLAFNNAAQPNIITIVSSGKIILVNKAACTLTGFSKRELLTKSRASVFDTNETSFKKMLSQGNAEGQSVTLVNIITKTGKAIPCEISSAVFMDEDGIEKAITTISDRSQSIRKQKEIDTKKDKIVEDNIILAKSRQKKVEVKKEKIVADNIIVAQERSDARLAENNEWIKYIAKASYDVMWDWDIVTGEIYVGDSIEEVFGYKVQNNTVHFNHFSRCLIREEKNTIEKKLFTTLGSDHKSWDDSYRFKRYDGSVASTTSRASIVRDEQGKAIRLIGAIQDVSRLQELEKKLDDQSTVENDNGDILLKASNLSIEGIWHWNLLTNEFFLSDRFEELFGYSTKNNGGNMDADWANYFHRDDKEAIIKSLYDAIASPVTYWESTYRFIKADGSVSRVFSRASIIRNNEGKACRIIGVMHNVSRQPEKKVTFPEPMEDRKPMLIGKIKNIIVDLVHYSDEQLQTNFSDYLSKKLEYDYTYLSNLFSEAEGIPIRKFIIVQKIERAKELMMTGEVSLTQIASKLHYSSVAHLSNQFKKVTGFTPSYFKQVQQQQLTASENV